MKRSRFTEKQIIGVLKEHEAGAKVAYLCRRHGMSEATLYAWKSKYCDMDVSQATRLRRLEGENGKLKRLLADAMPNNAALKDLLGEKKVATAAQREAVAQLRVAFEMSERRARLVVGSRRMTVRYRSVRPPDAPLCERRQALAHERRRFGYRRLHVLLRREGSALNHMA